MSKLSVLVSASLITLGGIGLAQAQANLTSARITARAAVTAQIYNSVLTAAQQSQYASQKAAFVARKAQWQQFKAEHPLPANASSAQSGITRKTVSRFRRTS